MEVARRNTRAARPIGNGDGRNAPWRRPAVRSSLPAIAPPVSRSSTTSRSTAPRRRSTSPAAVAKKVEPLAKLLEARTQLANLLTYMDGKGGAEELLGRVMKDPELLKSLAAAPKPAE